MMLNSSYFWQDVSTTVGNQLVSLILLFFLHKKVREFKSARLYPIRVREFKTREFKSARKIVLREFKYT